MWTLFAVVLSIRADHHMSHILPFMSGFFFLCMCVYSEIEKSLIDF